MAGYNIGRLPEVHTLSFGPAKLITTLSNVISSLMYSWGIHTSATPINLANSQVCMVVEAIPVPLPLLNLTLNSQVGCMFVEAMTVPLPLI